MARSWKALPVAEEGGPALKAPSYKDFLEQSERGQSFRPPRKVAEQLLIASAIIEALDVEDIRVPQGASYTLWRWPQGLAVETPSGWSLYVPLESQIKGPPSGPRTAEDLFGSDADPEETHEAREDANGGERPPRSSDN